MRSKTRKPFVNALAVLAALCLLFPPAMILHVQAAPSAQEGRVGKAEPAPSHLVFGQPPVRTTTAKTEAYQPMLKSVPAPDSPRATDDPAKPPRQQPAAGREGWELLMSEDFEYDFPTGSWSVSDCDWILNGEYYWDDDDYKPHAGAYSAWAANGGLSGLDPETNYYANDMCSWMIYGPIDLSNYSNAELDFQYWNQSEEGWDYFGWYASHDNSYFDGYNVSGDSGGWIYQSLDLSAYARDPSVWIAFVFSSDSSIVNVGPFVDDISLWGDYTSLAAWTYMVYLDGDNDLEGFGVDDFLEMSSVGSSASVNIVAQMDRYPGEDSRYGDWTDAYRFRITKDMTPTTANGTSIGEVNMGDPQTLIDFAQWAMSNYPAEHYALVLWDHGGGWKLDARQTEVTKGVAYDYSSGGDALDMPELHNLLDTVTLGGTQPLDLLGMDACLMAMIEVDNQLRPYANIRVGSEETEPGDGWPYTPILSALVQDPAMPASQLAGLTVYEYYASYGDNNTQSAVDLGTVYDSLNTAVDSLAVALVNSGGAFTTEIQTARDNTQKYHDPDFVDLYDFAYQLNLNVTQTSINTAAQAVMDAVGATVINELHGSTWPGSHGISIYFPSSSYDPRYDGDQGFMQFTANTHWDEWLKTYLNGPTPPSNDDFDTPIIISEVPYTTTQSAASATTAGDDPIFQCGSSNAGLASVWYQFTPSTDGWFHADTFSSSYDTMLELWTGSRGNLSSVACNDDANGTVQSRIGTPVTGGQTYYIEVAEYSYSSSPSAGMPPNDRYGKTGDRNPGTNTPVSKARIMQLNVDLVSGQNCTGGPNSALFTTQDNQDNLGTGYGDCDMDEYIFNDSLIHPIEFNLDVPNASSISSAQLLLLNWDVDQASGEVDQVYFNGHLAGTLTGANNEWSTTTLALSPSWIVTGNNQVQINVDVTNTAWWAVQIDWAQLVLNGQGGTARVRAVTLNRATYLPGSNVHVIAEVDTSLASQDLRTEINLRDPSGRILAGTSIMHTVNGTSNDPVSADFSVPSGAAAGTYSIQVLVYDAGSSLIQHIRTVPLRVVNSVSFVSIAAQDGWILESGETSNVGGTANSATSTLRLGDTWQRQQYRSIISFNTGAGLPDNAVITSIVLRVKKQSIVGGGNPITSFQGIRTDIMKGSFGLPGLQAGDFQTTSTSNRFRVFGPFKPAVDSRGWYTIRLPAGAGNFVNKASTYGGLTQMRLRFNLDDNNNLFANYLSLFSGNAVAGNRPVLILQYYVP